MATNIFLGEPPAKIKEFIIAHYGPSEPDMTKVPLTFTASGPVTIALNKQGTPNDITLEYSLDGFKTDPIPYTIGVGIELTDGQKMSMRAVSTNTTLNSSAFKCYYFTMTDEGTVTASGNIMSLLNKNFENVVEITSSSCFYNLFQNCKSLTSAPTLPATTLADFCYAYMFSGCTSLTSAPILPATTLANQCYYYMFSDCTSLEQAPELPTTLASYCYGMFWNTKSPFTISDKTFDEVADLIQNEYLIGGEDDYFETEPQPREIICSDKTIIATPEYNYYKDDVYYITGWTLTEK